MRIVITGLPDGRAIVYEDVESVVLATEGSDGGGHTAYYGDERRVKALAAVVLMGVRHEFGELTSEAVVAIARRKSGVTMSTLQLPPLPGDDAEIGEATDG